ncbi:hypothetical protein QR680_010468 [Steinernema hermaphroditum]|uniref:Uncharacterized protein n=1 Tax=Steinernema hermaphroditum TaxID=289476 RepID=A0AA39MBA3_9BILA|nr:hypothetical protein QR680_010468 [Steinernema hermaphroditum]
MSLLPAVVSFALLASAISAIPYYDPLYAPRGAPVADYRPRLPYKYFYDSPAADYTPAIYNAEESQYYAPNSREEAKYYLAEVNESEEGYSALDDVQDQTFKGREGKKRRGGSKRWTRKQCKKCGMRCRNYKPCKKYFSNKNNDDDKDKTGVRPLWTKERCMKCGKRCRMYKQCAKYFPNRNNDDNKHETGATILDITTPILEEMLEGWIQPTVEVPGLAETLVDVPEEVETYYEWDTNAENKVEENAKTFVEQQRESDSSTLKKGRGNRNPIKRGRQIKKILCIFLNCSSDEYE